MILSAGLSWRHDERRGDGDIAISQCLVLEQSDKEERKPAQGRYIQKTTEEFDSGEKIYKGEKHVLFLSSVFMPMTVDSPVAIARTLQWRDRISIEKV